MRKYPILLVIADGLGDRKVKALGGKTPLEAADKPNLRELYNSSLIGLMDPIAPGVPAGSDTSHMSILGVNPRLYYGGRGSFEALGAGARLSEGDLAFRGNFATVGPDMIVLDRRAGREIAEADELVKELNESIGEIRGVKVKFYRGTEHRVAVVLSGEGLSDKVTDTDPHSTGAKVLESKPADSTPQSKFTAEVINELTRRIAQVLSASKLNKKRVEAGLPPANVILLRGGSKYREMPKFKQYTGLEAAAVSATALVKGVCSSLGIEVVTPSGATGGIDTDYMAKASAAASLLKGGKDFVLLHVKATDAASHDGLADKKVHAIERIDGIIGHVMNSMGGEIVLAFTGDHSTPVELREHVGDPVPLLIYTPEAIVSDELNDFNERTAKTGSLRLTGLDLLNVLLNYANRASLYGA